ncbi:MAG: pseudouridylate synthase [Marinoscillum sp.]
MFNQFIVSVSDPFFIHFDEPIMHMELPEQLNDPFDYKPHALCKLASQQVQRHLESQTWEHNFGLIAGKSGTVIGKMFGVLVVKNTKDKIGFLAAFSGKIGGKNHYPHFVPPVFDGLEEGSFLNHGMQELTRINQQIKALETHHAGQHHHQAITELKQHRRDHSNSLQGRIYDHYQFLNQSGEERGLREIFESTHHANPPGGAGECAAPKLLQYAFKHHMKPLAMAEFWWGASPKSEQWKHKDYYPACTHKCAPILEFMLS